MVKPQSLTIFQGQAEGLRSEGGREGYLFCRVCNWFPIGRKKGEELFSSCMTSLLQLFNMAPSMFVMHL